MREKWQWLKPGWIWSRITRPPNLAGLAIYHGTKAEIIKRLEKAFDVIEGGVQ